jgi:hypothetical protein
VNYHTDLQFRLLVRMATWWSRPPLLASGINNFTVHSAAGPSRLGCPFLCPGGARFLVERGLLAAPGTGPSLGPPAGAHTTAAVKAVDETGGYHRCAVGVRVPFFWYVFPPPVC